MKKKLKNDWQCNEYKPSLDSDDPMEMVIMDKSDYEPTFCPNKTRCNITRFFPNKALPLRG